MPTGDEMNFNVVWALMQDTKDIKSDSGADLQTHGSKNKLNMEIWHPYTKHFY